MIKFSQILESKTSIYFLKQEIGEPNLDYEFSFVENKDLDLDLKWKYSNNFECYVNYDVFKANYGDVVYLLIYTELEFDKYKIEAFHNLYDSVFEMLKIWNIVIKQSDDFKMKIIEHKIDTKTYNIIEKFESTNHIINAVYKYEKNYKTFDLNNDLCKDERIKNLILSDKTMTKFNL